MPLPPSLCEDFYKWGRPKLRGLSDAKAEDGKAGIKRYGAFHRLREQYLLELEQEPFGKASFAAYLDEDGEPTLEQQEIRDRASSWLRNHSRARHTAQLAKFEASGGVSEPRASRVTSAAEMWADGEKARIRKATCEWLGIPVNTGNKALSDEWIGARKAVVTREFALLPQESQDEWNALARSERASAAKDRGSVISIQERQRGFAAWLDAGVAKKTKGRALGDVFVFKFSGYFVRAEDKQLERFRGQISSNTDAPRWFKSEEYNNIVAPVWTEFIHRDVGDRILFPLSKFPSGATGEALDKSRDELAQYFEEMFRIDCDFATLDTTAFWKAVTADPTKFVDPDRLPDEIPFAHPSKMDEDDFSEVYRHMWRCQHKANTVDRDARFIYEAEAVREYVTLERVQHLRAEQQRRERKAKAAKSSSGATSGNGPAPPPPVDPADPQLTSEEEGTPRPTETVSGAEPTVPEAGQVEAVPPASTTAVPPTPAAPTPASPMSRRDTPEDGDAGVAPTSQPVAAVTPPTDTIEHAGVQSPASPEGGQTAKRRGRGPGSRAPVKPPAKPPAKTPAKTSAKPPAKPPAKTSAAAAGRTRKRATRGAEEDEGEDSANEMPPRKKSKAAAGSRKRTAAGSGEEGVEDAGNASQQNDTLSPASSKSQKARANPKPSAGKPRYATRGKGEAKI